MVFIEKPLARVYYLNLQPWFTSYELPEYVVAYFWVNANKIRIFGLKCCDLTTILKVLMGKHGFYNGQENLKILKSHFFARKYISIWVHSIPKDAELQHLGGYVF